MRFNIKLKYIYLILLIICAVYHTANAQVEVIEVDSISKALNKSVPFDEAFVIKMELKHQAEVSDIFLVKKHRGSTLNQSIKFYKKKKNKRKKKKKKESKKWKYPIKLDKKYYRIEKFGEKRYLVVNIADNHIFKPSESFFIIPLFCNPDNHALDFFENYYFYNQSEDDTYLDKAKKSLEKYEENITRVYGNPLAFKLMTKGIFERKTREFNGDENVLKLQVLQKKFYEQKDGLDTDVEGKIKKLIPSIPTYEILKDVQFLKDAELKEKSIASIISKQLSHNTPIVDLNYLKASQQIQPILIGTTNLKDPFTKAIDKKSSSQKSLSQRIANLDTTLSVLHGIRRSIDLFQAKDGYKEELATDLQATINLIQVFQANRDNMTDLLTQKKAIDLTIMEKRFIGKNFKNSDSGIIAGNAYMNFDTRSKLLITPDVGLALSRIGKKNKDFDYGILPYLGFHINFMPLNKDIPFKSYKKNFRQRLSISAAWSMVSLEDDEEYDNFFEKSTLLTGVGFRLNNTIRITGGTQWLFTPVQAEPNGKLRALPYVGVAFDFNVKQYINGFIDIFSSGNEEDTASVLSNMN